LKCPGFHHVVPGFASVHLDGARSPLEASLLPLVGILYTFLVLAEAPSFISVHFAK